MDGQDLWGDAGEIAQGTVVDASGAVTEAWTGPQVAWGMARGSPGAFGGTAINNPWVWGAFCLVFLVGLVDWRRPFSLRNLDLLFLLSPTASLWYFNHGDVFTAVPLFYPLLIWVVLRGTWIGVRNRGTPGTPRWPVWALLGATIFLAGFKVGLNVERSNVIDVGYSGVIGAERIVHGTAPWGNFPVEHTKKSCGPADSSGEIRDWIQTNDRCESANPEGDTYGPVAYESYIPGYAILGWTGKWDDLPAAHFTAIAFDLLTLLGLFLVGLRFGGQRLGAVLAFAWAAYPFTQYVSNSNTNDALMPCFLVWGFWLVSRPAARGVLAALSGWTKFASLLVVPLWLTYPGRRPSWRFALGFVVATLAVFSILLLASDPFHEAHVFWTRTVGFQIGALRRGRSGTGASTTRAGFPISTSCSTCCRGCSLRERLLWPFSPLQVAAAARRVHGGAPRRLRAGGDVLALHVHPVVLSLRRDRPPCAGGAAPPARHTVRQGRGRARSPRPARRRCT